MFFFEILSVRLGSFSITIKLRNKIDNFEWFLTTVYDPMLAQHKQAFG
jgi:hypothetical protein